MGFMDFIEVEEMDDFRIMQGDCREKLAELPDASVHCCVTSPPYYALREYGTAEWEGGDPVCQHAEENPDVKFNVSENGFGKNVTIRHKGEVKCLKCGAVKVDRQIGLEQSPDEYVAGLAKVFMEVKRVLRPDGTFWLNIGETYSSGGTKQTGRDGREKNVQRKEAFATGKVDIRSAGIKPKDMMGIPWRVALALQGFAVIGIDELRGLCRAIDDVDTPALQAFRAGFHLWEELAGQGWFWLRQDIIWNKPVPVPESVTDRCTKSHEYVFMLAKSPSYYFDMEAIKEGRNDFGGRKAAASVVDGVEEYGETRQKKSVWTVPTSSASCGHIAMYPPDLIRPCILAGTSSGGCCSVCGAPYLREVEGVPGNTKGTKDTRTVGWKPSCECGGSVDKCTVLDPFNGSGTTGMVAVEHGRKYIGIELLPENAEMSRKRIAATPRRRQ